MALCGISYCSRLECFLALIRATTTRMIMAAPKMVRPTIRPVLVAGDRDLDSSSSAYSSRETEEMVLESTGNPAIESPEFAPAFTLFWMVAS